MPTLNPEWKYSNLHDLLIACVGLNYGASPEENIDKIRQDRGHHGRRIRRILELNANDRIADVGSGCGFVTRELAPHVAQVWCVDISPDFLAYCREELADFSNISYCLAGYGDFDQIASESLSACYATAVFIHFNFYDLIIYLKECSRILRANGRLAFDFLNADNIDYRKHDAFSRHLQGYKQTRESRIFNLVHPISLRALENLVPQLGFSLVRVEYLPRTANTTVLLRKTGDVDKIEVAA